MRTSIIVQNLKCGGCANTITKKLSEFHTISHIEVDATTATISFVAADADAGLNVKRLLKNIGYPSIDDANGVLSKAKSYVSCATGKLSK